MNKETAPVRSLPEQEEIRRQKLLKLDGEGKNPYIKTEYRVTASSAGIKNDAETYMDKEVSLAGRMMSRRVMGKAAFAHLLDGDGKIQLYIKRDDVGEGEYESFKKDYDIGDVIGVRGMVFRTKTGEITIHVVHIEMLSKALRPLPEKFNGLRDADARYRHREVDLIMNEEVRKTFIMRSRIISFIREYLNNLGFLEVDTPILGTLEIGAAARPFKTHLNALDLDMFLRIETELYLKRLIVGGFERVYEVGRIFRNEGMDARHNPEFTTIELYQAYANYKDIMDLVENLYRDLTLEVCGKSIISYGENEIDMGSPWRRMSMVEAVKLYSGEDYNDWKTDADAAAVARRRGVELEGKDEPTKGEVLVALFEHFAEDNLIQPTFIYDYPVEVSPLAKKDPKNPLFTERFEYFINKMEMGNAFSELNDPIDQRERFERQVAQRATEGIFAEVDEDFISALEQGMPPTGGLGFGIDRLVMVLTNSPSIRDVILFPTMKPLSKGQHDDDVDGDGDGDEKESE